MNSRIADLALTFGGRVNHHEVYGTEFSPRAYATYSLTDNWVIKGGVNKAFKAPTLAQFTPGYMKSACRGFCYLSSVILISKQKPLSAMK
nr:TonB-dependent receptor [Pectobacterium colocasium]